MRSMEDSASAITPSKILGWGWVAFSLLWSFLPPSDLVTSSSRKAKRTSPGYGMPSIGSWGRGYPVKAKCSPEMTLPWGT